MLLGVLASWLKSSRKSRLTQSCKSDSQSCTPMYVIVLLYYCTVWRKWKNNDLLFATICFYLACKSCKSQYIRLLYKVSFSNLVLIMSIFSYFGLRCMITSIFLLTESVMSKFFVSHNKNCILIIIPIIITYLSQSCWLLLSGCSSSSKLTVKRSKWGS